MIDMIKLYGPGTGGPHNYNPDKRADKKLIFQSLNVEQCHTEVRIIVVKVQLSSIEKPVPCTQQCYNG